ncbi:TetR/AcrR family transcriptional regulator [Actinomadura parmotrematis]|uniref:TetR/AcrR family transcriptional regulator n=1 Tax=Actinomadura parmotrematis TaxID=2864039 RepID=A0ABS7G3W4_9ACTN|nr:TetR/AcrR family transcriptional regulator [Actinomadura parmotrematis]MBW8487413.1 TetR/AcrR family transcriptional regulator [Actinomadura parmotrematis]
MVDAQHGLGGGTGGPRDGRPGAAGRPGGRAVATRRGGSRQERREQTRRALLAAAERLWAERGIHGASLDDIAASAGLTKGAVYSNFAGKTDLLLALLERYTADRAGGEPCAELCDTARPLEERVRRASRAYEQRVEGDRARLLHLLLVEFWLFGMRDYAAGWRIADWYAERRTHLAAHVPGPDGDAAGAPAGGDGAGDGAEVSAEDRAALAMAVDFGLTFQYLLDPARVSPALYEKGMRLILGSGLS